MYLARMGKVRWVYSVGDAYAIFDWLWREEGERSLELWWVVQSEGSKIACHTREAGVDGCTYVRK